MKTRSPRRAHRSWPQRLLITLNVAVAIACLAAAGGLTLVRTKLANVKVVSLGAPLAPKVASDQPRNILIIGTDNADRLDPKDSVRNDRPTGEHLADVIMILRLDPKKSTASLLSIPRDSWVPIAPFGTKSKINSAMGGTNGPQNLINTIKKNFGISIENYVQVDFAGFRDLVQVLQGVPVYLTVPVRDRNTGLLLTKTGCITLDPVQALAYARSRHFEYQDPKTRKWTTDPTSDLGRISRQQDFIQRAAQRAIEQGARNPATAYRLIGAAVNVVTIDDTMTVGQIRDLADRFGNFDVGSLQKYQLPTTSGGSSAISYQNVDWETAEPMLDIFRGISFGTPLAPHDVQVEVGASGSPIGGADAVTRALEKVGFDSDVDSSLNNGNATSKSPKTVIRYGAKGRGSAALLARYLDIKPQFVFDASLPGARLHLDPGSDLVAFRTEPLAETAVTFPPGGTTSTVKGATPVPGATTTTVNGGTTLPGTPTTSTPATSGTSSTTTTSTSVLGVIPVDAAAAAECR